VQSAISKVTPAGAINVQSAVPFVAESVLDFEYEAHTLRIRVVNASDSFRVGADDGDWDDLRVGQDEEGIMVGLIVGIEGDWDGLIVGIEGNWDGLIVGCNASATNELSFCFRFI
jgi:hypothetical protein